MANWALTNYAIEGPKETLQKIEDAIMHHETAKDSSEDWEGNVLNALGIDWQDMNTDVGNTPYMRGFICTDPWWCNDNTVLRFDAEETWGEMDFHTVLETGLPGIKVYYCTEEHDYEVYVTNDKDSKYFSDRYYVEACIDSLYCTDYFAEEEAVFKWLAMVTDSRVTSKEDVDIFNGDYEDSDACEDNWIRIHEFEIVD